MKNKLTIITLIQTFIMGSIDAYTFNNFDGSFVSAQTGNLVVFIYEFTKFGWHTAAFRLPVLLGFLIGAFIAQGFKQAHFQDNIKIQLEFGIGILLIILASVSLHSPKIWMLLILGFYSGYELTSFNIIGSAKVNNGIMTGNLKNFASNLFDAIFVKDPDSLHKALSFLGGIIAFCFGIGISAKLFLSSGVIVICVAILLTVILMLFNRFVTE